MIDNFWSSQTFYSVGDAAHLWIGIDPPAAGIILDRRVQIMVEKFTACIISGVLDVVGGPPGTKRVPLVHNWVMPKDEPSPIEHYFITLQTKIFRQSLEKFAELEGVRPAFLFPAERKGSHVSSSERTASAIFLVASKLAKENFPPGNVTHDVVNKILEEQGFKYNEEALFLAVWDSIPPDKKSRGGRPVRKLKT